MSRPFLVISATRAEAAHVPEGTPVVVTGLGKTAAAVATTQALLEADRDGLTVVNIGTAGALRDGVVGLHEVGRVLNHDISADMVRAQIKASEEHQSSGWLIWNAGNTYQEAALRPRS